MEKNGQYIVSHGGYDFLVSAATESPVCLIVHPLALEDGDGRSVTVVEITDTEYDKNKHSVVLPATINEEERDMWGIGVRVAAGVMAILTGDE